MFLGEPSPTAADLHFRLFGIPVRVHPLFWVVGLMLGINGPSEPLGVFVWVAVVFISILVHEMGHAFTQRHFGGHPWITLHGFGGLASCNDCDRSPRSQIIISLAGPFAGFLFAMVIIAAVRLAGHSIAIALFGGVLSLTTHGSGFSSLGSFELFDASFSHFQSPLLDNMVYDLLQVNILWGLVNLLPIYPLDGGQVAREVFTLRNPQRGIVLSLQVSIGTAVVVALYALSRKATFTCIMFGLLAYGSYQALRAYQNHWR